MTPLGVLLSALTLFAFGDGPVGASLVSNPLVKSSAHSYSTPSATTAKQLFTKNEKLFRLHTTDSGNAARDKKGLMLQMEGAVKLIHSVGVDGLLSALERVDPGCHAHAHHIGRAATHITHNMQDLMDACKDRCNHGCFHGIILGLVVDSYKGDFYSLPHKQQVAYMPGVFREVCEDSETSSTHQTGACAHGVGHAAALAAGNNMLDAMNVCLATFDKPGMQHRCGTGVAMQLQRKITNANRDCASLPLPVSCFEYAFRKHPIYRKYSNPTQYIYHLVDWARSNARNCLVLKKRVQREACVYGVGFTVSAAMLKHKNSFRTGLPKLRPIAEKKPVVAEEKPAVIAEEKPAGIEEKPAKILTKQLLITMPVGLPGSTDALPEDVQDFVKSSETNITISFSAPKPPSPTARGRQPSLKEFLSSSATTAASELCADIKELALVTACVQGLLKHLQAALPDGDPAAAVCKGLDQGKGSAMPPGSCLEVAERFIRDGDKQTEHFSVVPDL